MNTIANLDTNLDIKKTRAGISALVDFYELFRGYVFLQADGYPLGGRQIPCCFEWRNKGIVTD
jgi:hypothetical protein